MDRHVYEGLISGLEAEAEHNPGAFRGKVIMISSAAYFALFGMLLGAALLIYFGFGWANETHRLTHQIQMSVFTLIMLPLFIVVTRMFFMRLEPPEGRPVTRDEAPRLFEVLDRMRRKLKGPPIHHVLINREYNASIVQLPRWGLFGGHANYLMLGLPYLWGVPTNEMLATVAHEYGHLCGDHGKLSAWVYRQRRTIGALYDQVDGDAKDNWVYAAIAAALHRFMPYYNAYTFVMSRQNEYAADLTASELIGAEVNASGLIRDALLGQWVRDKFWPTLYQQADTSVRPLFMPFAAMRMAFAAGYEQWATPERLSLAWREKSDVHDTHPALRDRVTATGQRCHLPARVDVPAAETLLGASAKRITEEFDHAWWKDEKKDWESRHHYAVRSKARLQELSMQALNNLQLHELQELALLKSEFDSPQAAKPILEHLLRQPGGPFPKAAYYYGNILLDEDNERGLDYLTEAVDNDRSLFEHATRRCYFYLLNKRGEKAAEAWWDKMMPDDEE